MNVLAIDVGFAASGMAVFDISKSPAELLHVACSRPKKDTKKHHYVADSDVDRVRRMTSDIKHVVDTYNICLFIVELPSGGAQGARANRCMGIATGMIATLVEMYGIGVDWRTPGETRKAGLGEGGMFLLENVKRKKGDVKTKKEKSDNKKNIKDRVMENMERMYPELSSVTVKADKEHIADAVATYESAKDGNLIRALKGVAV